VCLHGSIDPSQYGHVHLTMRRSSSSCNETSNRIARTTSHGIDLRDLKGRARVERNILETGPIGRSGLPGEFVDALRLIGSGEWPTISSEPFEVHALDEALEFSRRQNAPRRAPGAAS
jgi:hypothetical protein